MFFDKAAGFIPLGFVSENALKQNPIKLNLTELLTTAFLDFSSVTVGFGADN